MKQKLDISESQNVEFKESWHDEYLKWICGFANAEGGRLYIGVNDKCEVVGVSDSKRLMEDIPNKIVNSLGIVCDVNLFDQEGVDYIEIVIESSTMPVSYHGQYHYRSGSTKQELKGIALQQFIMNKMGCSWDDIALENATIEDIDRSSVEYFLRCAIGVGRVSVEERDADTEDVLRNLGLMTSDGKLKTAAILLFGKNVRRFFPSAEFKIGRFHSSDSDLIIQDVIECNIIQMANQVIDVLRSKYLISPISYRGLQRVEDLEIPEMALREMIYNAIAHKDYVGPAIQMRVYDDYLEIWNYGLLPKELTPESLMRTHASFPRNKNIAYVFFKAGFIESWGRGYRKIQEEFELVNMPMFNIVEIDGGVKVVCVRRTIDEIIASHSGGSIDHRQNIGGNVAVIQLTDRQTNIVSLLLKKEDITARQVAVIMGIPLRTIERELSVLKKKGVIQHIGSSRAGRWIVLGNY